MSCTVHSPTDSLAQPSCTLVYIVCNPAPGGSPFELSLGLRSNSRVLSIPLPLRVSGVVVCPWFALGHLTRRSTWCFSTTYSLTWRKGEHLTNHHLLCQPNAASRFAIAIFLCWVSADLSLTDGDVVCGVLCSSDQYHLPSARFPSNNLRVTWLPLVLLELLCLAIHEAVTDCHRAGFTIKMCTGDTSLQHALLHFIVVSSHQVVSSWKGWCSLIHYCFQMKYIPYLDLKLTRRETLDGNLAANFHYWLLSFGIQGSRSSVHSTLWYLCNVNQDHSAGRPRTFPLGAQRPFNPNSLQIQDTWHTPRHFGSQVDRSIKASGWNRTNWWVPLQ